MELVPVVKHINQEKINRFAAISGGTGRIHVDIEYAKKTKFQSTLAHGILLVAYISEMMKNNFGKPWFTSGNMDVKFVKPAKPGNSLVSKGKIRKVEILNKKKRIECSVWIENEYGELIVDGNSSLEIELP